MSIKKRGVGKTVYTINIGTCLARLEKKVLLIDNWSAGTFSSQSWTKAHVLKNIAYSIALGSGIFLKRIEQYIYSYGKDREIQATNSISQSTPEKIISLVSNIFGISPEDILVKRKGNIYRTLAVLPNISPNTYHLKHFVNNIYQLLNRFSK